MIIDGRGMLSLGKGEWLKSPFKRYRQLSRHFIWKRKDHMIQNYIFTWIFDEC